MGFKRKTAARKKESALVMHHKYPLSTSSPTSNEMFSSSISIGNERTFMMGTGQSWTSSAQVMQQETYELRCKVRYLGCFCEKKPEKFFKKQSIYLMDNKNPKDCFKICSQKHSKLVARTPIKCICGNMLIQYKALSPSNKCKNNILTNPKVTCARNDVAAEIYLITKFCENETLTMESISSNFIGLFKEPSNFHETTISEPISDDSELTPVWCYLYCERKEQTLSMVTAAKKCHCGHTTDQFRLNNTLESKSNPVIRSDTVAVWRTAAQDFRCDLRIFLPPQTSETIFLRSVPGSGNTWLRHLIESATGVFTGSVYHDQVLASGGFLGELDNTSSGRTSVIKAHAAGNSNSKNIVLIRNPFDAILAEYTRRRSHSHTGLGNIKIFDKPDWTQSVKSLAKNWLSRNIAYLKSGKISLLLVVYYEDVKQDHVRELRRIVDFTGFKVNKLEERLLCLQLESTGLFKRPPRKDGFNPYSRDQIKLINDTIATLRSYIEKDAKSLPPLPNYEKQL
ncbi:sialate:O-sulfotransferase 1-like [Clavelina lepadiformis]|uniref:sialate:O-sulfotransferase 1-like n=1 Tax=Clavelina lepadiformis TaxID=159417 RepID=UPI004042912C